MHHPDSPTNNPTPDVPSRGLSEKQAPVLAPGARHYQRTLILLLILAVIWIAPLMLGHEPWLDEGYGFSIVYNILISGDPVVPTMAGLPFMEKPPLYYLLGALSAKTLSPWLELHDGARLINVLLLAACLLALAIAGRRLYSAELSLWPPLLFLCSLGFWDAFHRIITDVALITGFCIALAGMLWLDRKPIAGGLWLGLGAGITFMSKGLLGPGIIGLTALTLPLFLPAYHKRRWFIAMLFACLGALPWMVIWPAALYLRSPELFMDWFWTNNFGRFLGESALGPDEQFGFYLTTLLWQAWPALPLAAYSTARFYRQSIRASGVDSFSVACIAALLIAFLFQPDKVYALPLVVWLFWLVKRSLRAPDDSPHGIAILMFAVTLLVLSGAGTSTEIYAMPLLVPLALMAPVALDGFPDKAARWLDVAGMLLMSLATAVLWTGWAILLWSWPEAVSKHVLERVPNFTPGFGAWGFAIAALSTAAWIAALRRSPAGARGWVWHWLSSVCLIGVLIGTLWPRAIDGTLSYRQLFREFTAALEPEYNCIASSWHSESFRGLLQYRTGITLMDEEHHPGPMPNCDYRLLIVDQRIEDIEGEWKLVWQGRRNERDRPQYLYRRIDGRVAPMPGN